MAKFSWRSLSAYCGGSRDANDAFSKKIRECPLQATLKGAGQPRTLCPRVCLSLNSAGECTDTTAASSARASHAKVCSVAVTPFNRQTHDGTRTSSTAFGRVFCPEASRSRPFPTSALTLACAGRGSFRFVSSTRTSLLTFSSPLGLLSSPVAACSKSSSSPTVQVHPSSLSLSVQFPPGQPNETASLQPVAKRFLSGGHNNKKKKKDKASSKDEGKKEEKRLRRVLRVIGGGGLDHGEDFDEAPSSQPHGGGGRGMEDGSGRHRHAPSSPTPPHSERRARESSRHEQEEAEEDRHSGRRGEKPSFDLKAYERNMAAAIDSMVQKMKALLSTRERILDFEKILVAVAGEKRPLSDLAQVVMRGSTAVSVHVFSEANVPKVISALRAADSRWTIQEESQGAIKCQLPKMTAEMREELRTKARAFLTATKSEVRNLRQAGRSQLHKLQFKSHAIDETQRRELDVGLTNLMEAYVTKCDKVFNEKFQELRLADTH